MKIQKMIVNILLRIEGIFIKRVKPVNNRILFITTNGTRPSSDMEAIMSALRERGYTDLVFSGSDFDGSLKDKFKYFFTCIYQYYLMHTAELLLVDYNNFLVGEHKPKNLKVIELWHASGAVKKFGAQLEDVDYVIGGYDKVICNGSYWQNLYAEGFNVTPDKVKPVGLPRTQDLLHKAERYANHEPRVLYAPTFRGTRLTGIYNVDFDRESLQKSLPEGWVLDCKYHPFTKEESTTKDDIYTMLAKSNILVTDYSSLVFDFALLDRPTIFYVPDIDEYREKPGLNVNVETDMMGYVAHTQDELEHIINRVIKNGDNNGYWIHKKYMDFEYTLIDEIIDTLEN